jgi:transcriptional regulator with XRE-family HTH domain
MIKNDKQHKITKKKRDDFMSSLELLKSSNNNDLLKDIMINSLISQIETFDYELREYEILKNEKPQIITFNFNELPESLIKARIIKGFSQNELALKAGLKEQQIQRYESTNYESANFERLLNIAKSLEISFETSKIILRNDEIKVEGYDSLFIRRATGKLQSKKTLLTV